MLRKPQGDFGWDWNIAFAPLLWKAYALRDPQIPRTALKDGHDHTLSLSAQTLAPFTALEADQPGRFSDNAFTLIPGQDRVIHFTPSVAETPQFTLRHLHAATYGT